MSDTPEQRCALVTGSSRGIGYVIATELAKSGCNVCLNCASESGLEELREAASKLESDYGIRAIAHAASVASFDEAKDMVSACLDTFGRLDILVNNAGITRDKLIAMMSEEDFDAVIDVNLKGTFNCCKAATRPMMKQRYGRIVSLSSVVGLYGNAGQVNYAASKAGIIGITKSLAKELASRNITVNAVAPGFIDTSMTAALTDEQRAAIAERIACGRFGTPYDVACAVRFLASEDASYITGQVICIDGGLSI